MGTFSYKAKEGPGRVVEGVVEAESRPAAVEKLSRRGLFPLTLEERADDGARSGGVFTGRVSGKDLTLFTRQLADLLESNVPLLRALRVVQKQTENPRLAALLAAVTAEVEGGKSFSEALKKFPEVFPPLYGSLAKAGEVGGVLGTALGRLSEFTEQEEDLKSRLKAAAAYPLLIATVGAGTVLFLVTFVVPKLAGMFADTGQPLPAVTRFLIAASGFLTGPGGLWTAAAAALAGASLRGEGVRRSVLEFLSRAALRVPMWGNVLKRVAIARFARTLATLLAGGVSILEALEATADALGHAGLREQVLASAALIRDGAGLAESLRRMPDFPSFICNMIAVGEEGNILEKSLQKVAATYERDADRAMKTAASLMEPLMILAVGSVIGVIVVALLMPIFQIPTFVK